MVDWNRFRYQREKRAFIRSRLRSHSLLFHCTLIFTLTWLAGWMFCAILLRAGVTDMPIRYAIGFVLSYIVFILIVRMWANLMRFEGRGSAGDNWFDLPSTGDADGCLVAVGIFLVGFLFAGLFTLFGGIPLLLEVAFEVVFAGVMVRQLKRTEMIGNWVGRLIRNTWIHAVVTVLVLVGAAVWLQEKAPNAKTFSQAVKVLRAAR